jgi:hypothetical protein
MPDKLGNYMDDLRRHTCTTHYLMDRNASDDNLSDELRQLARKKQKRHQLAESILEI